eukprot:12589462-Alexandrium_andersonii.AAC.1
MSASLVGSEMCIRDSTNSARRLALLAQPAMKAEAACCCSQVGGRALGGFSGVSTDCLCAISQ